MQWSLYAGNKKPGRLFKWFLVALYRWSLYREKFELKILGKTTKWSLKTGGRFKKILTVTTRSTSPDMTEVFHALLYGRFIKIKANLRRSALHRTNKGSNFLGGSFSHRDNVRAPILFRREGQPQHLKKWFFLKKRAIHFHINSSSINRLVKWNQHWNQQSTSCPSSQCLVDQIQVQKPILIAVTDLMPDHT